MRFKDRAKLRMMVLNFNSSVFFRVRSTALLSSPCEWDWHPSCISWHKCSRKHRHVPTHSLLYQVLAFWSLISLVTGLVWLNNLTSYKSRPPYSMLLIMKLYNIQENLIVMACFPKMRKILPAFMVWIDRWFWANADKASRSNPHYSE